MLVEVRSSNEALLRAQVPEAQDQRGCPSSPSPFLFCRDDMIDTIPLSEYFIHIFARSPCP